jgi:hypothetical protein
LRARACSVLVACALGLLQASPASAQHTTQASRLSAYEQDTVERVLLGNVPIDPSPEGKIVEQVDIATIEVIEDRDPAPRFLNVFHNTTQASVLRRDVLLREGDRYRQYKVDETVRVLRLYSQLSLVLAIAVKGSRPNTVKLLILTKDVWSLRAQFDIRFGGGGLDVLRFEPTERNVGGTLNSIVTRVELYPETLTLGAATFIPRIGGRKLYVGSEGNVIMNRTSGDPEGTYGQVFASTPQVTAWQKWVYGTGVTWRNEIVRRYVGGRLATYDAPSTPDVEILPDAYRARILTQQASIGRSYGLAHKMDFLFGAEVSVRRYTFLAPELLTRAEDKQVVEEYLGSRVPRSDTRVAPFAQAHFYESRFLRVHDLDTLALQEDYRVGYDWWLRAYPVTQALGSSRDFLGVDTFAQYVLPINDGFARISSETLLELAHGEIPTAAFAGNAAFVSPRFFFGRILLDALAIARPENYPNRRSTLGGEGRLRGFPSAALIGQNVVAYNVELRTRPVEILSCQVAGATFFDVGDAFDGPNPALKSAVGFGFRGLLPQLDRKVFRFDIAFPLVRPTSETGPIGFYLAFEQAFPASIAGTPGAGPSQAMLNTHPGAGALGQ